MLEVGNDIFTEPEEQTHLSLWAIAKSPLVIGGRLNDTYGSMKASSFAILRNEDVIGYNQDNLGIAANLNRRYTESGFDVWAGPLSGGRTVAALVNWNNQSMTVILKLPDVGLQSAGTVKDVWNKKVSSNVVTSYSDKVAAHGTLLLELGDTVAAGTYEADQCGHTTADGIAFEEVYGITDSNRYRLTVNFENDDGGRKSITVSSSAKSDVQTIHSSNSTATMTVALQAGTSNTIKIKTSAKVSSIQVTPP